MKRQRKSVQRLCRLVAGVAVILSAPLFADDGESNRAIVILDADTTSFWRTATNNELSLPVEMPPLASSATLTVRGMKHDQTYEINSAGDFIVVLPSATSPQTEDVYDLTLTFNDGTVRTARLGLIQGFAAAGETATTRVFAPKDDAKWKGVKKRAVMPIPYGMASFTVNGVDTPTGLGGAQGWYALSVAPDAVADLLGETEEAALSATLLGLYDGFIMCFR